MKDATGRTRGANVAACSLWALGLAVGLAHGQTLPPGMYDIAARMSMPHLEESLRDLGTREHRCLAGQALATLFPALDEPGLRHCRLELADMRPAAPALELDYVLRCEGETATTGSAVWRLEGAEARGTLSVRLGGKNMTFAQQVTARRTGSCSE